MLFQFSDFIKAGLASGKFLPVISSSGIPLSMVRDATTGQIAGHAIGMVSNFGPLQPVSMGLNLMSGMYQIHQNNNILSGINTINSGLNSIASNISVLQGTTAVIGVGTLAGVALSAVNLYQILKLKESVKELGLKVENGFIDLKCALRDQGAEIIQIIEDVAQDIKFQQHRTILIRAYGLFTKAIDRLRSALQLSDVKRKNAEIDAVRGMLFESLSDYMNPHLLEEASSAGKLRRLECSWAIEQVIITTYQLQNELNVVNDRLDQFENKIRNDLGMVIDAAETFDEIDFIFPEITRIHDQDLALVISWKEHINWWRSLSLSDLELLTSSNVAKSDLVGISSNLGSSEIPREISLYEEMKAKSHYYSLKDQLLFLIAPSERLNAEKYILEQAAKSRSNGLNHPNLMLASNLTIANLRWYYRFRDDNLETA